MRQLNNSLPDELAKTLSSLAFEENGGLFIDSIQTSGKDLKVCFKLRLSDDKNDQQWIIKITGNIAERIVLTSTHTLQLFSDHELLWDYTDSHTELYFKGKSKNPYHLYKDLYKLHNRPFNDGMLETYINGTDGVFKLCESGFGLFARGPKKMLEQYKKCLEKHDVQANYMGDYPAEEKDLKLLFFGESYFIGKDFEFERIS